MERLYQGYREQVAFLLVYIREAHPDSILFVKDGEEKRLQKILQTSTLKDRTENAQLCKAALDLTIPALVDLDDNQVNAAYAGWPDRMVVVGRDGRIAYYGGPGPRGFKPNDVKQWLEENVARKPVRGQP